MREEFKEIKEDEQNEGENQIERERENHRLTENIQIKCNKNGGSYFFGKKEEDYSRSTILILHAPAGYHPPPLLSP